MRRRYPPGIVGIAIVTLALAGCGEDPGIQQGPVSFKSTSTEPFHAMSEQMKKITQERIHTKKSEGAGNSAAASKGAGESRPGAESKPAAKGG
jgi:hypothetical protein